MRLLLLAAILAISLTTATAQSANAWLINRRATATNYTSTATDWYIAATATLTNTLPLAASVRAGQAYVIKSTGAGNTVTIRPSGADTIDGTAGDLTLTAQAEVTLISNGATNWEKTMAFQSSYGTTINPTDGYFPYRSNATTFADSPLRVEGTGIAFPSLVSTNYFVRTNTYTMLIGDDPVGYSLWAFGNSNVTVLAEIGSSPFGAIVSTTGGQIDFGVNGRQLLFTSSLFRAGSSNVVDLGEQTVPWNDLWVGGQIQSEDSGLTNFLVTTSSGYTGTGTKFLSDDGTYRTGPASLSAYLAANATTTSATLANLSLSASVISGKKYAFTLVLFCANSVPADGVKIDFDGGSATATNFRAQAVGHDAALFLSQQVSALATDIAAATVTGDAQIEVNGSFEPSGSGTLIPRFAVNSATTGTLTVYRGSNLVLTEIP